MGEDVVLSADQWLPGVHEFLRLRNAEFAQIPEGRKKQLTALAGQVRDAHAVGSPVQIVFICTHNSRRSQLAQIWTLAAAAYFGIKNIDVYSGGTEVTAFNPRAIAALARLGLSVQPVSTENTTSSNPKYLVRFKREGVPFEARSKLYNESPNPIDKFIAVMTCSQADESCPVVKGAAARHSLPYDDPKAADGSSQENQVYDERSQQIAREMLFMVRASCTW